MPEEFDRDMPAIFLGGARHGELTTLKHGEAFPSENDIYLLKKQTNGCHIYCVLGLDDSRNAGQYFEKLGSLDAKMARLNELTVQHKKIREKELEIPVVLYHYTTLETLALILKNGTLRFNRLDKVNDPEEAQAPDLPRANEAVFSSSWTASVKESLPLWNIYGEGMRGVRIELPNNPFLGRHTPKPQPNDRSYQFVVPETMVKGKKCRLEIVRKGMSKNTLVTWCCAINRVRYSDLVADRKQECFEKQGDSLRFSLHHLGMVKQEHWSFEEEWRYRIFAISADARVPERDNPHEINQFDLEKYPVETEHLDVLLDPDCLRQIKITFGPRVSAAHKIYVESLMKEFAPDGEALSSAFRVNFPPAE